MRVWGRKVEQNTHSAIRTLPHLFQLKLLHTSFVGCDCCTFDANFVLENSVSGFDRDLIVCLRKTRVSTRQLPRARAIIT